MMLVYNTVNSLKMHSSVIYFSKIANKMLQQFREFHTVHTVHTNYTIGLSYYVMPTMNTLYL